VRITSTLAMKGRSYSVTRTLVLRLLLLEIGPLILALAFSYRFQNRIIWAASGAALVILLSVSLSVKDGFVLVAYGGGVCERAARPREFWLWIALHSLLAILFLSLPVFLFFHG